jgi:hypothetical protein
VYSQPIGFSATVVRLLGWLLAATGCCGLIGYCTEGFEGIFTRNLERWRSNKEG